jgi:hypothetical protein
VALDGVTERLVAERRTLAERVEGQREQLERLRAIAIELEERLHRDEVLLEDLDAVLGRATQLQLDDLDPRLRGQRLIKVALAVLAEERGPDAEVHYREWYELVRSRGHRVAGRDPVATFLAQINRSACVERVGRRTGRYRVRGEGGVGSSAVRS